MIVLMVVLMFVLMVILMAILMISVTVVTMMRPVTLREERTGLLRHVLVCEDQLVQGVKDERNTLLGQLGGETPHERQGEVRDVEEVGVVCNGDVDSGGQEQPPLT